MPVSAQVVSRLLDSIYEAAVQPDLWQTFLEEMRAITSANEFYFLMLDPQGLCSLSLHSGFDERTVQAYESYYSRVDVLLQGYGRRVREYGDWVGDSNSLMTRKALCQSEVFNDFCQPNGNSYYCGVGFGNDEGQIFGGLGLSHTEAQGEFGVDTIDLLAILTPHLKRAFALHRTLTQMKTENSEMRTSIESLGATIISVDRMGQVIRMTKAARDLFRKGDGLLLSGDRLVASVPHERARLDEIIAGAAATGAGSGIDRAVRSRQHKSPQSSSKLWSAPSGGAMLVSRAEPRRPLQVVVSPFRSSDLFLKDRPSALIFVNDPEAVTVPRTDVLRSLYAFTPTECRVAEYLGAGFDVSEIAAQLLISQETVRFYLKCIFKKTGTKRQSEFVRLLMGIPRACGE